MTTCRSRARCRAFTLIEMLAVMAIIAIVAVFIAPAASSLMRSSEVTQAETLLSDTLSQARQLALAKNESVEVRIISFADPESPGEKAGSFSTPTDINAPKYRAIQIMEVYPSGGTVQYSNAQLLPKTVMLSADARWSSLLSGTQGGTGSSSSSSSSMPTPPPPMMATAKDPSMTRGVNQNYQYVPFRFQPDGSTNLGPGPSGGGWFMTVHAITDLPKITSRNSMQGINFVTLQIDPVNGATHIYRPVAR